MRGYLLDTNILSELIRPHPEPRLLEFLEQQNDSLLYISVLTLGEISKGIALLAGESKRRLKLQHWLEHDLLERFTGRIILITAEIALSWGIISGRARQRGKPMAVIDCLLAATASELGLVLVTRNSLDFVDCDIVTLNPWIDHTGSTEDHL
jgi:toxin FitB